MEEVTKYSVYARVQPEHKTRIVKAWKVRGMVTAMTRDGVNDAPSIKAADIGIGMGITGTNVTKGVADMVLADDNFATIVNAVEEGRKIYDNVCKVLQFQLSTNMSEVIIMFVASILNFQLLEPVHLLWINMVTDSLPGLALGMEKAEGNLMKRKPRATTDGIFSHGAGDILLRAIFSSGTAANLRSLFLYPKQILFGKHFNVTKHSIFLFFCVPAFRLICLYNINEYIFNFLLKSIVIYAIISSKLWLFFMQ
ncbi:MAG TPA: hypothetical protein DHW68_03590 [Ruminococcaceae bacterium]|nr:hypothetical protein [Oscillospiraceae bacterium]